MRRRHALILWSLAWLAFALGCLAIAPPAQAQTQTTAGLAVGLHQWQALSYVGRIGPEGAAWSVQGNVEHQERYWRLGLAGDWSPASKNDLPNSWSVTGSLSAAFRPVEWLFVGAGESASYTNTELWRKSAFRPFVFAGLEADLPWSLGRARTSVRHTFVGSDVENRLRGETFDFSHVVGTWTGVHPAVGFYYSRWRFESGEKSYGGNTLGLLIGARVDL